MQRVQGLPSLQEGFTPIFHFFPLVQHRKGGRAAGQSAAVLHTDSISVGSYQPSAGWRVHHLCTNSQGPIQGGHCQASRGGSDASCVLLRVAQDSDARQGGLPAPLRLQWPHRRSALLTLARLPSSWFLSELIASPIDVSRAALPGRAVSS